MTRNDVLLISDFWAKNGDRISPQQVSNILSLNVGRKERAKKSFQLSRDFSAQARVLYSSYSEENGSLICESDKALSDNEKKIIKAEFEENTGFSVTSVKVISIETHAFNKKIGGTGTDINRIVEALTIEITGPLLKTFLFDLVRQATDISASDIHIISNFTKEGNAIAIRRDGEIAIEYPSTPAIAKSLVSFILNETNSADSSEENRPQSARFSIAVGNEKSVDLRIQTIPNANGTRMVIRILDKSNLLDIEGLFPFFPKITKNLKNLTKIDGRTGGLTAVIGPMGQGKTTSIYAMLQSIDPIAKHIVTIEDPVEYNLPMVTQINYNERIHESMHLLLAQVMRSDADVIVVGEVRDYKTASLVIEAALSGHRIFVTSHAGSVDQFIRRLIQMFPPEQQSTVKTNLATVLSGVIQQSLFGRLCEHCKTPIAPNAQMSKLFGTDKVFAKNQNGCRNCNGGIQGRIAASEAIFIDQTALAREALMRIIANEQNVSSIRDVEGVSYFSAQDSISHLLGLGEIGLDSALSALGVSR